MLYIVLTIILLASRFIVYQAAYITFFTFVLIVLSYLLPGVQILTGLSWNLFAFFFIFDIIFSLVFSLYINKKPASVDVKENSLPYLKCFALFLTYYFVSHLLYFNQNPIIDFNYQNQGNFFTFVIGYTLFSIFSILSGYIFLDTATTSIKIFKNYLNNYH